MIILFNDRRVYGLFLMMVFTTMSHAKTVGNITCGTDNTAGEQVVCDYAVLSFKYQKLIDTQFTNQRSPELEAEVKKNISACADLPCVEAIIDRQMALPITEPAKVNATASVTEPPKPKFTSDRTSVEAVPKKEGAGGGSAIAVIFLLFLVFLPFWIIFRKRKPPAKNESSTDTGWFALFIAFVAYLANEAAKPGTATGHKVDVVVKPYSKSPSDGFNWDGVVLRPYSGSPSDGWELTGQIFKRYSQSPSDGYEWDGTHLKPYGRSNLDGYEWDGRILRPYGKSFSDGYELDGNNMVPYGKSRTDGWEATGPVPIPVWACVFGLVS